MTSKCKMVAPRRVLPRLFTFMAHLVQSYKKELSPWTRAFQGTSLATGYRPLQSFMLVSIRCCMSS